MTERNQEEQDSRIDQMTVDLEKMRFDMAAEQKKLAWETRKFLIQAIIAAGLHPRRLPDVNLPAL